MQSRLLPSDKIAFARRGEPDRFTQAMFWATLINYRDETYLPTPIAASLAR